jgi:hypothetical protein
MKVVALFQIYLPYYLPRTEEWSTAPYLQHHFDVEGQIVNVHPRKADEQLFPNPIDKQLSQLEIPIESGFIISADGPRVIAVRDRCFDRIEAQVFGEVSSTEDCLKPDVTFAYRRSAISACNQFLYHCRVAGRDGEIRGLAWHYNFGDDRSYFPYPHTLIWFDADTKEVLRDGEGREFWVAQSGAIRSPIRVPIQLSKVNSSLSGDGPSLPLAILVSAKERLMLEEFHEGLVNLGSACEVASTQFIQRKGMTSDATVKQLLQQHKSFAEKRYHDIPQHLTGRSLKTEDAASYTLLENAYKTRNSVVHTGEMKFRAGTPPTITVATRSMINDFFRGCEVAVDWIEAL